jgi:hypothetical protein
MMPTIGRSEHLNPLVDWIGTEMGDLAKKRVGNIINMCNCADDSICGKDEKGSWQLGISNSDHLSQPPNHTVKLRKSGHV